MPQFHPIQLILPSKPSQQVMQSLDNYTAKEVSALKEDQKEGFIHILKSSIHLKNKNQRIRKNWMEALDKKRYLSQQKSQFYYYSVQKENHKTVGFIGGCAASEFEKGSITLHEETYTKRVVHMMHYLKKVQIQAEPVILIYEDKSKLKLNFSTLEQRSPLVEFEFDQAEHKLWPLNEKETKVLKEWSSLQAYFHLADGHHRVASLRNLAKQDQQSYLLSSFLVHKDQLQLYSFVWFLKTSLSENLRSRLLDLTKELKTEVIDIDKRDKLNYDIILKIDTTYYGLKEHFSNPPAFIHQTFKSVTPGLLKELDYVADTSKGIDTKRWESCNLVFFMKPISFDLLFKYAKSGKNLPAKSTYILPKLLTGFLISPLH